MNPSIAPAESSFLLWSLGIVVYGLAAHTGLAAVRLGRRLDNPGSRAALAATAGMAWGTAISIGFVLGLAGMALAFGLGFQLSVGLGLWLGGALVAGLAAAALIRWPGTLVQTGAGVALGALSVAVQAGWLWSAGLRPGLTWPPEVMAAAGTVMALGMAIAVGAAFSQAANASRLRWRWRLAAAGLMALAWLAGQEAILAGMGLNSQVGSVYQHQLSASLLALVGGALVPIILLAVAIDLRHRRKQHRRLDRKRNRELTSQMDPTETFDMLSTADAQAEPQPDTRRRRKVRIRGL